VDADGNTGAFSPIQTMALPLKLGISVSGFLIRRTMGSVAVTVTDPGFKGVAGVSIKASGAGVKVTTLKTGASGKVTFRLKPTKKGKITFAATKTGCTSVSQTLTVN
jgi:hypothetical protein